MKDLLLTLLHWAVRTATLCGPGGVRAVIAENLLLKQQLIVLRRPRQRAPRLTASDRLLFGFGSLFLSPGRIRKVAIGVRPSTLLAFHQALVHRNYRRLFSSSECPKQPGPKGTSAALIQAIVEITSRNPQFGCPRIVRIIARTFGVNIDKHVVYRVLSKHYRPTPGGTGPWRCCTNRHWPARCHLSVSNSLSGRHWELDQVPAVGDPTDIVQGAQLIGLGRTRYWKGPRGLQLDVGPFLAALAHATGCTALVFGKPAPSFFAALVEELGEPARFVAMVGDDIVSDVGGAMSAGLMGVLVRTGKFRPRDLDGRIRPDVVVDSVSELIDRRPAR